MIVLSITPRWCDCTFYNQSTMSLLVTTTVRWCGCTFYNGSMIWYNFPQQLDDVIVLSASAWRWFTVIALFTTVRWCDCTSHNCSIMWLHFLQRLMVIVLSTNQTRMHCYLPQRLYDGIVLSTTSRLHDCIFHDDLMMFLYFPQRFDNMTVLSTSSQWCHCTYHKDPKMWFHFR